MKPESSIAAEACASAEIMHSNYGICRGLDKRKHVGSWIVRLRRDGQRVGVRYFYDHLYPSTELALQAARLYRNELLVLHPPLSSREYRQRLTGRNTSGVPGVTFDPGRKSGYWMASTLLSDGTVVSKRFAIMLHGDEGAKQLAIAERHKQLQQIDHVKTRDPNVAQLFQRRAERDGPGAVAGDRSLEKMACRLDDSARTTLLQHAPALRTGITGRPR